MENWANIIIKAVVGVLLIIVLFFTSFESVAYNMTYYNWHYEKYNIMKYTKMDKEDLHYTMSELLKYFKGQRKDLLIKSNINGENVQVFNEREIKHLEDCLILFKRATMLRNISFVGIIIVMFIVHKYRYSLLPSILNTMKNAVYISIGAIISLGIVISTNFDFFFELFHKLSFDNDLWLLDPDTDVLINIVPIEFFINTCVLILIAYLFFSLTTIYITKILRNWLINKV